MPTPTEGVHRNLISVQRAAFIEAAGREAADLLRAGYRVEADQVLDELMIRMEVWKMDGQSA